MGHKVTVSCTECLHFVALQMALYLHSVWYTLDVSFYHPAHPFTACFKTLFFSFYIELQISPVYIKTQQQPYSKSKKFRILFLRCINGRKLAKKKPTRFVLLNHYISWENKPRFLSRFMPHLIQNQSHKVPVVSACISVLS